MNNDLYIRLAVAQGTLLWQPVKFGGCLPTLPGTTFTLVLALDKELADCKSALKRLNGNNPATSCKNLMNFRPIISEFMLLKHTIFAAIRPQFDDDLRSKKRDWNIAILISA